MSRSRTFFPSSFNLLLLALLLVLSTSIDLSAQRRNRRSNSNAKPATVQQDTAQIRTTGLSPQEEWLKVLVPSSTRSVKNLNGTWERSTNGGDSWTPMNLPASETYTGEILYRRDIVIDDGDAPIYMWHLMFAGVSDLVQVKINGQYVGKYLGAMVPFTVRINQGFIRNGKNTIELAVSTASDLSHRAHRQTVFGQRVFTGVVHDVVLVGTPHVMVQSLRSAVKLTNNSALVNIFTSIQSGAIERIYNDTNRTIATTKATLSIVTSLRKRSTGELAASDTREVVIERDRTINLQTALTVTNPTLWSPSDPNLYDLSATISINGQLLDDYMVATAIAEYAPMSSGSDGFLLLNGQPFSVKAIDYVCEYAGVGQTMSAEQIERDVQMLMTLGVNTVRVRYSSPHPYFVHVCNQYGILLIIEMPVYDVPKGLLGSDDVLSRMKNITERLLSAYEGQPCIMGWCISDGLQEGTSALSGYQQMCVEEFRKVSTRLLLKAVRMRAKSVDVNGIDGVIVVADRFDLTAEQCASELQRMASITNKPLLCAFGKPVEPDNHNGYSDPISIEAQAQYIQRCFEAARIANVGGILLWSFNDYSLNHSVTLTKTAGDWVCYSGIVDQSRNQRTGFTMYKALLNQEKNPLLQMGTYSDSSSIFYIIIGIALLVALIVILNQSRRFREYVIRSLIQPYNFYADIRDQRILSRSQTVILAAIIATTLAIYISSLLYYARMSPVGDFATMILFPHDVMKTLISRVSWSPFLGVIFMLFLILIKLLFVPILLRIGALFVRTKITFQDTFIITVWSYTPVLLLLPFVTVLFRLLDITSPGLWIAILCIVALWVLYRILRATVVVFDSQPLIVYGIGTSVIVGLMILVFTTYQLSASFVSYLSYMFAVVL